MSCRAAPWTPQHKGKVERGVGYVRNNALKGRRFESLAEENLHLQQWEAERRRQTHPRHHAQTGGGLF